jgi:hypothetical protein
MHSRVNRYFTAVSLVKWVTVFTVRCLLPPAQQSAYGHVKQQAFGLTEDWRKRKLAGQTGLGNGSPRPSPRGDPGDSDLRVGKAGSGWRPHVTGDHAEARSSRSATGTGEDSPRRERVKLPEVRSATARKSKQQKQPQESHASYQVSNATCLMSDLSSPGHSPRAIGRGQVYIGTLDMFMT